MSANALWLALYFPRLALDRAAGANSDQSIDNATVMVVQAHARRLVQSTNAAAHALGIRPGMTLNSAYAICPPLHVHEYDEDRQQLLLKQLCLWALKYSSWVSVRQPDMLLIEASASLKLFKGLQPLIQRIQTDCNSMSLQLQIGIAPVTTAACLFARLPPAEHQDLNPVAGAIGITSPACLQTLLGPVAVSYLPLDTFTQAGLRQSGIKRCEQLFRLPASALGRRFGTPCVDLVNALLGKVPETCPAFEPPDAFSQRIDLPLETRDTEALRFPLRRLLLSLSGFLINRALGVRRLTLTLHHARRPDTTLPIGFLEPASNVDHLLKILLERLSRLSLHTALEEPTNAMTIDTEELAPVENRIQDLFGGNPSQPGQDHHAQTGIGQLIERLTARLGDSKLYQPALADDHRPEQASYIRSSFSITTASSRRLPLTSDTPQWPKRPLWLLPQPIRAPESLQLTGNPERIEYGWWDNLDVRRDYYMVNDTHGTRYWVFTERGQTKPVFIHGLFG